MEDHEIVDRTISTKWTPKGELMIHCKCGAVWSMNIDVTEEEIQDLFNSHKSYAKHDAIKPL